MTYTAELPADFPQAITVTPDRLPDMRGLPYVLRFFVRVAARFEHGSLSAMLPDGRVFHFQGRKPGRHGILIIRNFRCLNRLLRGGNVGFAEGYLEGEWESPSVTALLEVVAINTERVQEFFRGQFLTRILNRAMHVLNRNSRTGARKNIYAHYDLGNAFYQRWLDPTMTYSSARFESDGQDLSAAQANKYKSLAERIGLKPGHTVLEIGCGWGGFAEFAAKEYGAHVTGITISREQYDFAKKRLFESGLNEKVDIRLIDYRDMTGEFDRVASIEMFEAVGEAYWPAYFGKVRDSLRPGGVAGLQIITISDRYFDTYRRSADFIQRYVFPGGMLPSPAVLKAEVARAGLNWRGDVAFGLDYARTLERWRQRFVAAWDDIKGQGFDERFKRLWTYYLSYCEAGFRAGSIDVAQIAISKN